MTKTGRKQKIYPQKEIDSILDLYIEEEDVYGKIEYLKVHRFALNLYENQKIPYKLSEDYWRKPNRQGRMTIDNYNNVIVDNVLASNKREITIVNVEDAVLKNKGNLDILISTLKTNEEQLRICIEKENELELKVKKLENALQEEKQKNKILEEKSDILQTTLFQFFEYGTSTDVPIINLLNSGKTKHKRVKNAFDKIFDSPDQFLEMLEEKTEVKNKVVPIKKETENILNDYDF